MCRVILTGALLLATLATCTPLSHHPSNPSICTSLSATVTNLHTSASYNVKVKLTSSSPSLRLSHARVEWYESIADPTDDAEVRHSTPQSLTLVQ